MKHLSCKFENVLQHLTFGTFDCKWRCCRSKRCWRGSGRRWRRSSGSIRVRKQIRNLQSKERRKLRTTLLDASVHKVNLKLFIIFIIFLNVSETCQKIIQIIHQVFYIKIISAQIFQVKWSFSLSRFPSMSQWTIGLSTPQFYKKIFSWI